MHLRVQRSQQSSLLEKACYPPQNPKNYQPPRRWSLFPISSVLAERLTPVLIAAKVPFLSFGLIFGPLFGPFSTILLSTPEWGQSLRSLFGQRLNALGAFPAATLLETCLKRAFSDGWHLISSCHASRCNCIIYCTQITAQFSLSVHSLPSISNVFPLFSLSSFLFRRHTKMYSTFSYLPPLSNTQTNC